MCEQKHVKVAEEGVLKERRRLTVVNTVHYVSLPPHGTATTPTLTPSSTMLQMYDGQVMVQGIGCGGLRVLESYTEASMKREACACGTLTATEKST